MIKPHPDRPPILHPLLSGLEALPQAARNTVNFLILHSDFVEEITSGSTITEDRLDEMRDTALARKDFMLYALLSYQKARNNK